MKCARDGCNFTKHPNIKNNMGTHCCRMCKLNGNHGVCCKKMSILNQNVPPKEDFRNLCVSNLNYIRTFQIPSIQYGNFKEAVIVEFRIFPHVEFLIRNAIKKLGNTWSYTIVCGNINHASMINVAEAIHPNIKVIKIDADNLEPSQYSLLLASKDFWQLFNGEKILIYQEDSLIFGNNIDDFLKWDYIGAPWPPNQNDTANSVGNGGLSLRSRSIMLKVISKISIHDTIPNSSSARYMKNTNSTTLPEDVYFSKNMQEHGIGQVSPWNEAYKFSSESICNRNSFGGHQFWISDDKWKERIYNDILIQVQCESKLRHNHRGGWDYVLNAMKESNVLVKESSYTFLSMVEEAYLWRLTQRPKGKWCGFVHCTPNLPANLNFGAVDISNMIRSSAFLSDIKNCKVLFTLSNHIKDYLLENIPNPPKIVSLVHPTVNNNIPMFTMEKYEQNENKHIIQVGQQLRKVSSIYKIKAPNFRKLWLTGMPNLNNCKNMLQKEDPDLGFDFSIMYYTKTYEEYDAFLEKNIVFIDLYDSAANNTVVECIIRNTPIILNRTAGVLEYLGTNYPLYFNDLSEVGALLDIDKIKTAYIYLKNMPKEQFSIDTFMNSLVSNL